MIERSKPEIEMRKVNIAVLIECRGGNDFSTEGNIMLFVGEEEEEKSTNENVDEMGFCPSSRIERCETTRRDGRVRSLDS